MTDDFLNDGIIKEFLAQEQTLKEMGVSINSLLNTLLRDNGLDTHSISHRVKDLLSLESKIKKKSKYRNIKDITDILGFRIITFYSEDIDRIEEIIKKEFIIDKKNSIDKRKAIEPDRFGYMSLHYIVSLKKARLSLPEYKGISGHKFEIQIRTILQHSWAEIEHKLGYKSKNSMPDEIRRSFSILSGTLELVDKEFLNIKRDINNYDKEVRDEVIKNTTEDILINERSLVALIDSDNDLEIQYDNYKLRAINSGLPINETVAKDIQFHHLQDGVEILKSLGVKSVSDLQSIIRDSVNLNSLDAILDYGINVKLQSAFGKYTFFMFLVYISYFKKFNNLSPMKKIISGVDYMENVLGKALRNIS